MAITGKDKATPPDAEHTALVLGVNGQDGSYIAECLLAKGYRVVGIGRQTTSRWVQEPNFTYECLDIAYLQSLNAMLESVHPDIVFHFATIHGAAGYCYEDVGQTCHLVNTVAVQVILEYIRRKNPRCRLVYPSSAKALGSKLPPLVDDSTPRKSECIYSITKNASHELIDYYRQKHDIHASVMTLFNHESPRRTQGYFIPNLVGHLAQAILDPSHRGTVYSLDMICDWGDAQEYSSLMVAAGELAEPQDFILATGHSMTGHELAADIFSRAGLKYAHILSKTAEHKLKPIDYRVDITKLAQYLWAPRRRIADVCMDILKENHPAAWEKGDFRQ